MLAAPDPAAFIRDLCSLKPPTFEDDWLDFKNHPGTGNEEKVKEMWGEALSGMANNQGGVIIWGVDARKTKTAESIRKAFALTGTLLQFFLAPWPFFSTLM